MSGLMAAKAKRTSINQMDYNTDLEVARPKFTSVSGLAQRPLDAAPKTCQHSHLVSNTNIACKK